MFKRYFDKRGRVFLAELKLCKKICETVFSITMYCAFCYCNLLMASGVHTVAVLNKLTKSELIQLLLNTEANLGSQISDLCMKVKNILNHFMKLEVDVAIYRNVGDKLAESRFRLIGSAGKILSVHDVIPSWLWVYLAHLTITSLRKRYGVYLKKIGIVVPECEIQACHRLRVKERIIVKLSTGKTPSISRGIKKAQVARSYRVGFFWGC